MGRLFGTDGVRGHVGEALTAELATVLGAAAASHLLSTGETALLARDTRSSGVGLEQALAAGLTRQGARVQSLGVLPSPVLAWLVPQRGARLGVMVSASHNPEPDNGIKFFDAHGRKLAEADQKAIEAIVAGPLPLPRQQGAWQRQAAGEVLSPYIEHLERAYAGQIPGLTVVVDSANGAMSGLAAPLLHSLGAEVVSINNRPNGTNINHQAGSTDTCELRRTVLERRAALGLAFDGDGDRALAVDERGLSVDGDHLLAMFGLEMHARGELRSDLVVATVMSNLALEQLLRGHGIRLVRTPVGDRHVLDAMERLGASLGGEQSGHLIDLRHNRTGDGLLTSLHLLALLGHERRPLSELAAVLRPFPQVLKNVPVPALPTDWLADGEIGAAIERVRCELGPDGRVLVRPSGTEPVVRVMVEGRDWQRIGELADELGSALSARLAKAVA